MSLQDLLPNAIGGFATGLCWGLIDPSLRIEKKMDFFDLGSPKEERESVGLSDQRMKEMRTSIGIVKTIGPMASAGVYAIVSGFNNPNGLAVPRNWLIALPFAYLGSLVGRGIRKFKDREERGKIKLIRGLRDKYGVPPEAIQDYSKLYNYLLDDNQKQLADEAFLEIEQAILKGKSYFDMLIGGIAPCAKLSNVVTNFNGGDFYKNLLSHSLGLKQEKVLGRAHNQRVITGFYEHDVPEIGPLASKVMDCVLIGTPNQPKLRGFVKEKDSLYTLTLEWPIMRIVHDESKGISGTGGMKIVDSQREPWTGDYGELAQRTLDSQSEGYCPVLGKSEGDSSERLKSIALASTYIPEFLKQEASASCSRASEKSAD